MEDNQTTIYAVSNKRGKLAKLPTTTRGNPADMSSASYWLSLINQSEAAANHQVSLGFFKLALEAGCENVEQLRDELKSYASRHNLFDDVGVSSKRVKKVFHNYNISETYILSAPKIKMTEYLAFEIQAEIMKRLPIKSLIQFRSISKQWKSLIDSSKFVADFNHLRHTQLTQHLLVRYRDPEDNYVEKYVSVVDDDDAFPQLKFPLTSPMRHNFSTIIGCSQGLFCVCKFHVSAKESVSSTVVLWNPSIQKSVSIDMPNLKNWPYKIVVGFVVCPVTNDPKLVKITYIGFKQSQPEIPWQVEIFPLSSGVWRAPYSSNLPRTSILFETPDDFGLGGLAIDRCIYWLAHATDDRAWRHLIMSFDMVVEEFTEICLPESLAHKTEIDLSIFKSKESLVVLESINTAEGRVYDVWMMEHGVPNSFTKLYTIHTPDELLSAVIGFSKSGEPIITIEKDTEQEAVFVYEPSSQHITDTGICGSRFSFFASCYMETLLLLDR